MKSSSIRNAIPSASNLRSTLKTKARARRAQLADVAQATSAGVVPRNDLLPNLTLVDWPPDQLKLPARNVRKVGPAHRQEIVNSIKAFGFCHPPLIDAAGSVLDGVARVQAAKSLGLTTIDVYRSGISSLRSAVSSGSRSIGWVRRGNGIWLSSEPNSPS